MPFRQSVHRLIYNTVKLPTNKLIANLTINSTNYIATLTYITQFMYKKIPHTTQARKGISNFRQLTKTNEIERKNSW